MKRILFINGNPDAGNGTFDAYCTAVTGRLAASGNAVRSLLLSEMKIGDCIGCYDCWLKTPGVCVRRDDHVEVLKGYVWGDLAILASPVRMGFVSAQFKKAHDRMIPLVHPFLTLWQASARWARPWDRRAYWSSSSWTPIRHPNTRRHPKPRNCKAPSSGSMRTTGVPRLPAMAFPWRKVLQGRSSRPWRHAN